MLFLTFIGIRVMSIQNRLGGGLRLRNPTWIFIVAPLLKNLGGRSEIRTHGPRKETPVFKTGALDRSAILPYLLLR